MATTRLFVGYFILLVALSECLARYPMHKGDSKAFSKRGLFDCVPEGESCRGFPKCCGDLTCHWEGGYSLIRSGVCSQCQSRGADCQRDVQCCSGLCEKDYTGKLNGNCT